MRRVVVEKVAASVEAGAETGRRAAIAYGRNKVAKGLTVAISTGTLTRIGRRVAAKKVSG